MAGATLCASGATFAWQAQHFDCLGRAFGARNTLGAGRLGSGCNCVAGATLCASGATFAWQAQHFAHFVHLELLLRGRRNTLTVWGVLRGFGRRWAPAAIAWQAQHFVHLELLLELLLRGRRSTLTVWEVLGARLGAAGLRLQLRGRRNTLCIWSYFCVAGAPIALLQLRGTRFVHLELLLRGRRSTLTVWEVLGARLGAAGLPAAIAWQAQHFVHLELLLRGRRSTLTVWEVLVRGLGAAGLPLQLRGRRSTLCIWSYFCVAGAALRLSGTCWRALGRRWAPGAIAWQAQHFVHLELLLRGRCSTLRTLCIWSWAFAWQAQHFDCIWEATCRCALGAHFGAPAAIAWQGQCFVHLELLAIAWQAQHFVCSTLRSYFVHLELLCVAGAAL